MAAMPERRRRGLTSDRDLARWRLHTQYLVEPHAASAGDIVGHLLAVQAENPAPSAWAVAARTEAPDAGDLARALTDGSVVRTHVLRPTWHYVGATDVEWLVELTAAPILRTTRLQLGTGHGMDGAVIETASEAILDALAAGQLTRSELVAALADRGHDFAGQALGLLLADLEARTLVCSGPPANDGTHTYAAFADRVPAQPRRDRAEALAELALRCFRGHGPATEGDLAYWATLTLGDVRIGLAEVAGQLESFEYDGRTFWHASGRPPQRQGKPGAHLLQILDEMYRGYQDSRRIIDGERIVPGGRESTTGMALVDGQLVAGMKRTVGADRVVFELYPHRPLEQGEAAALDDAAARYGRFLGLTPAVTMP
jgi:hypothetical protein